MSLLVIIILLISSVNGCFENNNKFVDRNKFLGKFSNFHKLNNVSLLGTFGSGTYRRDIVQERTQSLSIKQQLRHGVRVLELGLAAVSNKFALHTGPIFLGLYFEDVLSDVEEFLDKNPREFVILMIKEDYEAGKDVTMTNCQIIDSYKKNFTRILINWDLNYSFKKVRGKILLATQSFGFECVINFHRKCLIQNKECKKMKSVDEIDNKWESILELQISSFYKKKQCFVNNLSYYGSKHSQNVIANHGYFDSSGECITPINRRMAKKFLNPHRGLTIVVAVFPTQKLIDKINFSNFESSDKKNINSLINVIEI